MRKFFRIFAYVLEAIMVGLLIFGIFYAAKWVGSHDLLSVKDVFNGA